MPSSSVFTATEHTASRPHPAGKALQKTEALAVYRTLLVARRAEEAIRQEYGRDEMKTPVHLGIGQEAIPVGVMHVVPPRTKAFGTYRNHALFLTMTNDAERFFGELYGKVTGPGRGKAGSMHLSAPDHGLLATSAVVGTTIPVAVGVALANQYRHVDELVVSFFGDGAVEEGVFWESLNFACLRGLRMLFVCEDNGLAIHTPVHQRQGFGSLLEVARGFDCAVATADGSDLMSVIDATQALLGQMQGKPGLLHCSYFRFLEHVGPREDFDAGYRHKPPAELLKRADPVARFEETLVSLGCTSQELTAVADEVQVQIAAGIRAAREAPFAPPEELQTDVFA